MRLIAFSRLHVAPSTKGSEHAQVNDLRLEEEVQAPLPEHAYVSLQGSSRVGADVGVFPPLPLGLGAVI